MTWVANGLGISPAMAPSISPQDELRFLHDRHYALHGRILVFTVAAIFTLLLIFFIFVVPCYLRRRAASETSEPFRWWNYPLLMLTTRRTNPPETPQRLEDELERRY
ncbi:hypothetical protein LOK49_LG05G01443 [Camellia lanceoleosa]|uniref:Uncharacterized protein n=1 Tax=Camellia lanceoleosa TaxID=1840588 RepID=A0ACC0HL36_9ERIC|nr:hypothetical protein LOK49_LG05G01443 [Camellia lanceoleosa]